jgi:exopolysaccharide biosynthesis polyprenyl glycosylphosphotransferase
MATPGLISSSAVPSAAPVHAGSLPPGERSAFARREFSGLLPGKLLTRRVVILGSGPMAAKIVEEVEATEGSRHVIAGIVDHEEPQAPWAKNTKWLGAPSHLTEIVCRVRPDRIVVAFADRRDRLPLQLLLESRVRGVIVEDAVEFYERYTGKIAIEALNPSSLILSKGFRNHGAAEIVARIVSVVAATIGLILSTPLLLAIAIAIKLDSRGPVLFIQPRAGRNGRAFGLLKFRTMHPCEERQSEWVRDNIHRITRLGGWLRRFRLDELPQLVNVVKGEMNLVGPRPHPTSNHEIFMQRIAYYPLRSTVRPGVTGWAQVRYGYANNLEEETEKMRYDLFYIKNRSLWLDVWILLRTILIMIFGQGATEVRRRRPRSPARERTWTTPTPIRRPAPEPGYAPVLVTSTAPQPSAGQQ